MVLISENGTACSSVVAKADLSQENFLLANLFPGKTQLFFSDGSQNAYQDHFNWGEDNLKQSLSADLAVDQEIAGKIILKYITGEASDVFRRRMDHLVMKELAVLARALDGASKKADTRVIYMNPFFHLHNIFTQSFKNQFERSVTLRPLSLDLISQKFGFDITFKHSADAAHAFCTIATLIEWYLSPHDDKMSQLAKRRVRWLSPV